MRPENLYGRKFMNILETERLLLREFKEDDFNDLCLMLCDREVMYAYEHAFSLQEARAWLEKQFARYQNDGIGLWAVILKETGELIGQCGLTLQETPEKTVTEIGYLFRREYWHNGYAIEAADACKKYAFNVLGVNEVYSIIRDNNFASRRVAERNGMQIVGGFTKHYYGIDMPHLIYRCKKTN